VTRGIGPAVAAELARLAPSGLLVVTDAHVAPHYLEPLEAALPAAAEAVVLEPGEAGKDLAAVERIYAACRRVDLDRGAVGGNPSAMYNDEAREEPKSETQVVHHANDRSLSLAIEGAQQAEQGELVLDVEPRQRLVQKQDARVLGEQRREPHTLPLPARQLVNPPARETVDFAGRHRPVHGLGVLEAIAEEHATVGMPTEPHMLTNGGEGRRLGVLDEQPQQTGPLPSSEGADRAPAQLDPSGARRQKPSKRPHKGGLARSVRADDGDHLVRSHVERDPAKDRRAAQLDVNTLRSEHRHRSHPERYMR